MGIPENIAVIQARIAAAAKRAGRDPGAVTLMAVSKTFRASAIQEAYAAGIRVFGENRVQEFTEKSSALRELHDASFHLIGHLQSNKAGKAAELFTSIDSVDSLKLAERLNAAAEKADKRLGILIEINIGGEEQKAGVAPDSAELEQLLQGVARLHSIRVRGLMCIPPHTDDPEGARPYFRRMRELFQALTARNLPGVTLKELSMGMSHDFEVAVEEGSTCVRLGTAIFGERAAPQA